VRRVGAERKPLAKLPAVQRIKAKFLLRLALQFVALW